VHGARQVAQRGDLGRPFDERARHADEIVPEQRLGQGKFEILLARGDDERRPRLLGVVQHAEPIAETWRRVQVHQCEAPRGLRIAVGDAHHCGFLQAEHVAHPFLDRERVHERELGRAGIAEDELDAFLHAEFEESALAFEMRHI